MNVMGTVKLLIASVVIAGIWLIVLPRIGNLPIFRASIQRNQAAGIDPSAMYYTDLEHLEYSDTGLKRRSE